MVGGANSAGQAALFLARYAAQVHILIRRDDLAETMSSYLLERVTHHPRIVVHPRSELSLVSGDEHLKTVTWNDSTRDADITLPAAAVFLMIGAVPHTDWLRDSGVQRDTKGFVITQTGFATTLPGVFAVGDVRSGSVKRVASSVGEGSVVISAVHAYLDAASTHP